MTANGLSFLVVCVQLVLQTTILVSSYVDYKQCKCFYSAILPLLSLVLGTTSVEPFLQAIIMALYLRVFDSEEVGVHNEHLSCQSSTELFVFAITSFRSTSPLAATILLPTSPPSS
jgi:hypothetical protein